MAVRRNLTLATRRLAQLAMVTSAFALGGGTAAAQGFNVLHTFSGVAPDGASPETALLQANDGNFYGTTVGGGTANAGIVFKMDLSGTVTTLHSFLGGVDGRNPRGALIQATDGNLYGTTLNEGDGGAGTVFKITLTGTLTVLHAFTGGIDGGHPNAGVIQASDGNFYGTTVFGGAGASGTVFKMTPAGALTTLHPFTGAPDGAFPNASLVQALDGNFYGTTTQGGGGVLGTVFKMTSNGTVSILHTFSGPDGLQPGGSLIQALDGNLYGTASAGGSANLGTVFKITTGGAFTPLHDFGGGSTDGSRSPSALLQLTDGNFVGTTAQGGSADAGVVFEMTPGGATTVIYSFMGTTDGFGPIAPVIHATDGNLYGTAPFAGGGFGDTFRLRNPASCDDTLGLTYSAGTLTMAFTIKTTTSATWATWLFAQNIAAQLWSIPIPTVLPAVSFSVPIPNFPPIGPVLVLTTLIPTTGSACFDFKVINTTAGGGSIP